MKELSKHLPFENTIKKYPSHQTSKRIKTKNINVSKKEIIAVNRAESSS
tara:strand:+ start:883 stop:1029 length:147 start_codon:yes stop_codon:yes gene_type:complete